MTAIAQRLRGVSPFGPLFGKELRVTARRKRSYALRVLYLAALLLVMLFISTVNRPSNYGGGNAAARAQAQEQLGQEFFGCFVVFTTIAILLSLGALLVVGQPAISSQNVLVRTVLHLDNFFDGPFSRDHGVFAFTGDNAVKLNAVCNWGLGAVVYMIVGNVLRSLLRPTPKRPS